MAFVFMKPAAWRVAQTTDDTAGSQCGVSRGWMPGEKGSVGAGVTGDGNEAMFCFVSFFIYFCYC